MTGGPDTTGGPGTTSSTAMATASTPGTCRVGMDLAAVSDVEAAIGAHGDRYLRRVFTAHELDCCRRAGGWSHESLAARFAAKEATIKVLQPEGNQPDWNCMEVRRQPGGSCKLSLSGTAARMAESAGITSLSLSMTHDGDVAAAVVFALCGSPPESALTLPGGRTPGRLEFAAISERKTADA
jgi:holo-[acyl-carrier protein] synthase